MHKTSKGLQTMWTVFFLVSFFILPAFGQADHPGGWDAPEPESMEEIRPSAGKERPGRLSFELHGLFSLPVSGDAGAGTDAPGYADAFGAGGGANLKVGLALAPALALRLDLGSIIYPGKRFDSLGTENLFSDMKTAHLLVGVDLYFPFNLPKKKWFEFEKEVSFTGFAPHISLRGGVQYMDHLRWIEPRPKWSYWESSVGGMLALWLGIDYRSSSAFGFSAGLEFLYSGASPTADRSGGRASADDMLAFGLTAGVTIRF
jgi:hypothetical protein